MKIVKCERRNCSWNVLKICISPDIYLVEEGNYLDCMTFLSNEEDIPSDLFFRYSQHLMDFLRSLERRENE